MAKELLMIKVEPASELGRVLADAGDRSVILESKGVHYTIARGDDDAFAS